MNIRSHTYSKVNVSVIEEILQSPKPSFGKMHVFQQIINFMLYMPTPCKHTGVQCSYK